MEYPAQSLLMAPRAPVRSTARWWEAPEFLRSLPLFLLAIVFFTAGVVIKVFFPAYALWGPGVFTFWALLLALGFTCSIGGVISWTLAGESAGGADVEDDEPTEPAPTYLPIEATRASPPPPADLPRYPPVRDRRDFGRPAPDARAAGASAAGPDFYEGPTDSERLLGSEYGVPIEAGPSPPESDDASDLDEAPGPFEPVEKVLADLERIERDLAPKARVVEPTSG